MHITANLVHHIQARVRTPLDLCGSSGRITSTLGRSEFSGGTIVSKVLIGASRRVINSLKTSKHGPIFVAFCPAACFPSRPIVFSGLPSKCVRTLPKDWRNACRVATLAQENRECNHAQLSQVAVTRVEFDPVTAIPADAQEEIQRSCEGTCSRRMLTVPYQTDLGTIRRIPVGGWRATRNRGYFKVTATAKLTVSWSEEQTSVLLWLSVPRPGRHTKGDILIESTIAFYPPRNSPSAWRDLHATSKRPTVSVEKVRSGLQTCAV